MLRTKFIPVAIASAIAVGAVGFASIAKAEKENAGEMAAVLNAKTSVIQAISTAERQVGGNAVSINVDHEKGAYLYKVRVVGSEKLSEVFIDPATGNVIRAEDEGAVARTHSEDQAEFTKLAGAGTTLTSAVTTAEQQSGGKAIEAAFGIDNGSLLFEVEVAKDKTMHKVMIDPATGKVVKVAAAANGESGEGDEEESD